MNIQEIMRILPHRYPFLLLDRIVELRPGKMVVGIKTLVSMSLILPVTQPAHYRRE